jgi:hypothetical protein
MMMISAITPPPIYMVDAPPPCSLPQEVGHLQRRAEGVSFRTQGGISALVKRRSLSDEIVPVSARSSERRALRTALNR